MQRLLAFSTNGTKEITVPAQHVYWERLAFVSQKHGFEMTALVSWSFWKPRVSVDLLLVPYGEPYERLYDVLFETLLFFLAVLSILCVFRQKEYMISTVFVF